MKEQNKQKTAWAAGDLEQPLGRVFGFSAFRPYQEDIVRAILAGRDAFVVMPTGGGKSLCYQLPAHLMKGTCLVVSPLISLMKDQVDAACETGLRAAFINSAQSPAEQQAVEQTLRAGGLDLLYVSPERVAMPEFKRLLQALPLSFVAIDEAHCISEWGHDFRPDYLGLSALADLLPGVPLAAFTATATLKVARDIIAKLRLRDPLRVRASFNRPNLFYEVLPKTDADLQILQFIEAHPGQQGIVYRTTRSQVDMTATFLASRHIKALPYHAGMEDQDRVKHQEAFNRDEVTVIVATIAFGMGIDKSNVRFVIHGDLPKNIEGYYQETGRAGRDGDPAHCLLLFSRGDMSRLRYFIDKIEDEEARDHARRCMNEMARYAAAHACRRKQLLAYFGETYPAESCGHCDVCAGQVEQVDATRDAQMALSAIIRTGGRFGIKHVVDVLLGAPTPKVTARKHDQLPTYGVGKDQDAAHWRAVIEQLLVKGYARQTTDRYPVVSASQTAWPVIKGETQMVMCKPAPVKARPRRASAFVGEGDPALFEELRAWRKQKATDRGVPPYVILSDRSLREISHRCPVTLEALSAIHGIGETKLDQFGPDVLAAVQGYLQRKKTGS